MDGFATAKIDNRGNVSHGGDESLFVEFTLEALQNEYKSEQAGRPIFDEIPHIRIQFPGDRTKSVFRQVKDEDKFRFSKQWEAFQRQEEQTVSGTPLAEWPTLRKAEVQELKALNIHSVEQLASISDTALTWLGARELRDKAKSWLALAQDGAEHTRILKENADLRLDIESLKAQVAELAAIASSKDEKHEKKKHKEQEDK